MSRKQYSREFKVAAVERLNREGSVAGVARALEVHENVLRRWKKELEEYPTRAFPGLGRPMPSESREAELERKIGQMALENDFLKKALQRLEEEHLLANVSAGRRFTPRSKRK